MQHEKKEHQIALFGELALERDFGSVARYNYVMHHFLSLSIVIILYITV